MKEHHPLDSTLSPFTGWSRTHWEAVADTLLDAARRYSSPGHAQVSFPAAGSQDATDRLEGFARTFLLASLRLAGTRGDCPGIVQWYTAALDAGTAPQSAERWPDLVDHGQPTVEATSIVVGLHFSRPWIWEQLSVRVQDNIARWLMPVRHSYGADNNHVMFAATIQAFLASCGYPHDRFEIEAALARIEDWYAGDGWYSDGIGRRFDHYNAWTFQLYPFLILELLNEPERTGRWGLYRSRLDAFLRGYQHLFGADGSPLLQGRSLTYRWGVVAPFWMAQLQGVTAVSPGRTRRLASGVLRHFVDHGAVDDGVPSLGWHGGHRSILQSYNAPGSPHWASKGFLGLLLPAEHPAWTDTECPLPVEQHDTSVTLPAPAWSVSGTTEDGVVRVLNFGSDGHPRKDEGLYRRTAFSTATVPALEPFADGSTARDNDLFLVGPRGSSTHCGLRGGVARPGGGSSRFALDLDGRLVTVDFAATVIDGVEIRAARLSGGMGLTAAVSGYLMSSDRPLGTWSDSIMAHVDGLRRAASGVTARHQGSAVAMLSVVDDIAVEPECLGGPSTALGRHSALPLIYLTQLPSNVVQVAWLVGLGDSAGSLAEVVGGVELEWTDDGAEVHFRGHQRILPWLREALWPADQLAQGVFGRNLDR